jgi:glycosyltransferase involved in cell wall biosynthesis
MRRSWREPIYEEAPVIVGIDASNLRSGGGVTHLVGVLSAAEPRGAGVYQVVVWGGENTLGRLPRRDWLETCHDARLDRSLPWRSVWQQRVLPSLSLGCDVLFSPGGNVPSGVRRPVVTMHRNMLPFDLRELARYGLSATTARLLLLRVQQGRSLRRADGVIFLTELAERRVREVVPINARVRVIPHGLDPDWRQPPRPARPVAEVDSARPLVALYVSIVDVYKHQWNVARAVGRLRREGTPIALRLVGPAYPAALRRLERVLREEDPHRRFLTYVGPLPHADIQKEYAHADLSIMASTCEALPNVLLEAMGSGMPIASSDREPMPEVLGDAGVYFDPESIDSIAAALKRLAEDPALRDRLATRAFERAGAYSWSRCARATFEFLAEVGTGARATADTTTGPGVRRD